MSYGTVQAEKVTTESGYSLGAGNASSFKNRLINGNMAIDQRYAGSAYSPANGYSVDRWTSGYYAPAGGTYSAQRVVDAPAGFYYSLKMTVTATPSNNNDSFFQLYQPIEANNVADFALGTASAKSFTFSFWVKSSLTGTFCVAFTNNTSPAYSYVSTYTINSANTWEYKTVTVTGPTAGTWDTANGQGISVFFDLGSGTAEEASSANTWSVGNYRRVSGAVRLINTNGATLNVTGCQLELGTVATSFDFRSYGAELVLCQRYYQQIGGAAYSSIAFGINFSGAQVVRGNYIKYTTTMRANPTMAISGSLVATDRTGFDTAVTGISGSATGLDSASCYFTKGAVTGSDYYPVQIAVANATTSYLTFSAEL